LSVSSLTAALVAGTPIPASAPPPQIPVIITAQAAEAVLPSADPASPETEAAPPATQAAAQTMAAPADQPPAPPAEGEEGAGEGADDGAIVVTGITKAPPGDPMIKFNLKTFEATQSVDRALVGPMAMAYKDTVPRPLRTGLRNFFRNIEAPIVFLNFLLQLKPGKALETLGRFVINSTLGLGGFIDVAREEPFDLPYRPNGFADTLGYYGVEPGPFFFLPLVGPTTLRDVIGGGIDGLVLPLSVGSPFNKLEYTVPTGVVRALDYRVEFDAKLNEIMTESDDPYTASREYYLQTRQDQIDSLRGIRHDPSSFKLLPNPSPSQSDKKEAGEVTPR